MHRKIYSGKDLSNIKRRNCVAVDYLHRNNAVIKNVLSSFLIIFLKQSNSLKAHRLIHTGDKPVFQCELCPTTCGRKTDLRLHVQKLHTAVQPVHCKMCGKAFPDRYTLKVNL